MQWYVLFLLANELCEKFSFFGIRVLLNQYLKTGFGLTDEEAKAYVHLFTALVCMFPAVGGAISDSYLGKYTTVVVFSLVSLLGSALMAVFSIDGVVGEFGNFPIWTFLLPVVLIAIGSGCSKPCISSHAGDQVNKRDLARFFTAFTTVGYFGVLLAVLCIPLMKNNLGYSLSYGILALSLLLSVVAFVSGKRYYKVFPPQGELLPWKITKLVAHATARKLKGHTASSWLDLARDQYEEELILEARQFLRVVGLFLPLVFVWMLHEQNMTEWQNQYELMNKNVFGIHVPTESCSIYSTLFIMALVPATGLLLFPFLERHGILLSSGMRVALGYFLVVVAFIVSNCLQYWVQINSTSLKLKNNVAISCEGCVSGAWQLPQWFIFSLGEAILAPSSTVLAYSNVGPRMKATAISVTIVTISIGNYAVIVLEPILHAFTSDKITHQWCYIAIASIFFLIYLALMKFWFIPSQIAQSLLGAPIAR